MRMYWPFVFGENRRAKTGRGGGLPELCDGGREEAKNMFDKLYNIWPNINLNI